MVWHEKLKHNQNKSPKGYFIACVANDVCYTSSLSHLGSLLSQHY